MLIFVIIVFDQVQTLTNEGGRLKRDRMLARDRDFKLLPEPVWKALSSWYGNSLSLPRTVSGTIPWVSSSYIFISVTVLKVHK